MTSPSVTRNALTLFFIVFSLRSRTFPPCCLKNSLFCDRGIGSSSRDLFSSIASSKSSLFVLTFGNHFHAKVTQLRRASLLLGVEVDTATLGAPMADCISPCIDTATATPRCTALNDGNVGHPSVWECVCAVCGGSLRFCFDSRR